MQKDLCSLQSPIPLVPALSDFVTSMSDHLAPCLECNIDLAKKWCGGGNGGQNSDLCGLVELALMASLNIPFDIAIKQWPPKAVKEGAACGIKALVAKAIMGITDKGKAEGWRNIQLVLSVGLQPS